MGRPRRRRFFQRQPTHLHLARANPGAIRQTAQADVQRRRAKTGRANFRQVLQLEQDFGIRAAAVTVHHCFALFIIFGQGPGCDPLHVAGAKTRTTVRVENFAGS